MIQQRLFQTMPTTTTTTTRLINISADCIAEILKHIDLQHLNRLYECGNHALQQIMHRGGVQSITSMSFKQPPLTILHSRYPFVRELYIKSYHDVSNWCRLQFTEIDLPDHIFPIPSPETSLDHLRTLHIDRTNFFHSSNPTSEEILCLPKSLTNLMLRGVNITDKIVMVLPQSLITLSLPDDVLLTDAGVACLPQSLKHLYLATNTNITSVGFASLPSGLLSLRISLATLNDSDILCLSNNTVSLQSLDLGYCRNLTEECIIFLPQNLTKLMMPMYTSCSPSSISRLPPALVSLSIGNITSSFGSSRLITWPVNLKRLSVGFLWNVDDEYDSADSDGYDDDESDTESDKNPKACHFSNEDVENLPRTLTSLEIFGATTIDDDGVLLLPPHLLYLRVKYECNIGDIGIANLPRGLLSLCLKSNQYVTDRSFLRLPPNLLSLKLPNNVGIGMMENCLMHLPVTLMKLNLKLASHRFTTDCFKLLPRNLVKLHFGMMERRRERKLDSSGTEFLPPCLTSLNIGHVLGHLLPSKMPRSLTRVRLGRYGSLVLERSDQIPLGLKWMQPPPSSLSSPPHDASKSTNCDDVKSIVLLSLIFTAAIFATLHFQDLRSWYIYK